MRDARIPRARLNQIALRKLEALGVSSKMSADQERLEGSFETRGALLHPRTGEPIPRIDFLVHGHDQLLFLQPPSLRGLPPQQFFDLRDVSRILDQVRIRLEQRASAVEQLQRRLNGLGLSTEIDEVRLRAVASLDLTGVGKARLEGDERGLFITELARIGRDATPVEPVPVPLEGMDDRMDLELAVGDLADKAVERKVEKPAARAEQPQFEQPPPVLAGTARSPDTVPTARPAELVTLGKLGQMLGEAAVVLPGAVMQKDLTAAGKRIRFAARVDGPTSLAGKVVTPDGVVWSGHFELGDFPGVEDFVAGLLGTADVQVRAPAPVQLPEAPAAAAPDPATIGELGGQPLPVPGEVWVMNTLVEQDDGTEIRYVGVDIDGQPFGAPRVLPKEVFERIFCMLSPGVYQLPVQIAAVEPDKVSYFQLDPQRQQVGEPRSSRLAAFLSNFAPEAAAY
ncbi:MAG: hypothetical protein JXR96_15385 [Deltaproteobacteria bacterium]|nr:hypothetical protein [Deltaproteobacteria bacterium]